MAKRIAFVISDSTGITAETLGKSLLSHFDNIEFEVHLLPYIDSLEKAERAVIQINRAAEQSASRPIIFDTIIDAGIRRTIARCNGFMVDIFTTFLAPLERELQAHSTFTVSRRQSVAQNSDYAARIRAVHYAIDNDDGQHASNYEPAQLILFGVSRCGKTPTSLYMALQYGVFVANYPLTDDDLHEAGLPTALEPHQAKLFGLTIEAQRLAEIRQKRRTNSRYASIGQCETELRLAESLFKRFRIPCVDTTHASIEEISARVMSMTGAKRNCS